MFNIPEQFDMMDLIIEFKPMLNAQIDMENEEEKVDAVTESLLDI